MLIRPLPIFLCILTLIMSCCGLSTCGSFLNEDEAVVEVFLNPKEVEENLNETLLMMNIDCKSIDVKNDEVIVSIEQPEFPQDEQVEFLYLSVFNTASRLAPFSEEIILIILIDNDPFIQVSIATESIRLYRNGSISKLELFNHLRIQEP